MDTIDSELSLVRRFIADPRHRTLIVAEAEVNHNGSVALAKQMILKAKELGCDAVKFQAYVTENFVRVDSRDYEEFKSYELAEKDFLELKKFAETIGICVFSTAVEPASVETIERVGFPIVKIGSSNISNAPLLRKVARLRRPVLLSTGASKLDEIRAAVKILTSCGASEIALLHCTVQYPTRPEEANLNMIAALRRAFPDHPIGFSDHTVGVSAAPAAVALGATIIEKHFTLDRSMEGPDHAISADPATMEMMVRMVREVEQELGSQEKTPIASELPKIAAMRRRIVAASDLPKGLRLTEKDITCMRNEQGKGLEPWRWDEFVGKKLERAIPRGEPILLEDLVS